MSPWTRRMGGGRLGWTVTAGLWLTLVGLALLWRTEPTATLWGRIDSPGWDAVIAARPVDTSPPAGVPFAEADSGGCYELRLKPGTYELEASHDGFQLALRTVTLTEGQRRREDFQLAKATARYDSDLDRPAVWLPRRVIPTAESPSLGLRGRFETPTVTVRVGRLDLDRLLRDRGGSSWASYWGDAIGTRGMRKLLPYLRPAAEYAIDVPPAEGGAAVSRYLELRPLAPAAYVVEVIAGEQLQRVGLQVTDLAAVVKTEADALSVFCCDLTTGQPRAGTVVELWDRDVGEVVATATADAAGLARLVPPDAEVREHVVYAHAGEHGAMVLARRWTDSTERVTHLYTDRPIYRPGQQVYLKGIVRDRRGTGYAIPAPQPVRLWVYDGRGQRVHELRTTSNDRGSFSAAFDIPEEAFNGDWTLDASINGASANASVAVAAYLKPTYRVTVGAPAGPLPPGGTVTVGIKAAYYFGAPVSAGEVTWSVRRSQGWWTPRRPGEESVEPWVEALYAETDGGYDGWGEEVLSGRGRLDANGKLQIDLPLDRLIQVRRALPGRAADGQPTVPLPTSPARFFCTATVNDGTGRSETAGSGASLVLPADGVVELGCDPYSLDPAEPLHSTAEVFDAGSRPLAGRPVRFLAFHEQMVLDLAYRDERSETVRWVQEKVPDGPYHGLRSDDKRRYELVRRRIVRPGPRGEAVTDAAGRARWSVKLPRPGDWTIVAVAADRVGRLAIDVQSVWQRALEPTGWSEPLSAGLSEPSIELRTDSRRHQLGEAATARLTASKPGWVWLTHEDEVLSESRVIKTTGPSEAVDFTAGEGDVPYGSVAACQVVDGELLRGEGILRVEPTAKLLAVTVAADRDEARPGETVRFTVTCRRRGRPVDAEVSLAVVDESLYAIRPDHPEQAALAFWGQGSGGVGTWFSAEAVYYSTAGVEALGKGVAGEVRRHFPDTALWQPHLLTGADGTVSVSLRLPDTLGQWRALAIAHDRETAVGFGVGQLLVTKPLLVGLEMPRFVTQGDSFRITAAVHNETDRPREVNCVLDAPAFGVDQPSEQRVKVPARGRRNVTWRATCSGADDARVRVGVHADGLRDLVERSVPVRPWAIDRRVRLTAVAVAEQPAQVVLDLPPDALPSRARLRVVAGADYVGPLFAAADGLLEDSCGGSLETAARILGSLAADRAARMVGAAAQPARDAAIRRGLLRLRRLQQYDGGWAWWEHGEPTEELTALSLAALLAARDAGFEPAPEVIGLGLGWLAERIRASATPASWGAGDRALALWVLARGGRTVPAEAVDRLLRCKARDLDAAAASLATLAARDSKQRALTDRALRLSWKMLSHRTPEADSVLDLSWGLRAQYATGGDSPRVSRLAEALDSRFDGQGWRSTVETAFAVQALSALLVDRGFEPLDGELRPVLGDRPIGSAGFRRGALPMASLPLPGEALRPGRNVLRLDYRGSGAPRVNVVGTVPCRASSFDPEAAGLTVTRQYFRLSRTPAGTFRRTPTDRLAVDDVVLVRLTVKADRSERYVLVEDSLPAGCEIVEPGDVRDRSGTTATEEIGWSGGYAAADVRDDRVLFYFETVAEGQELTLSYLLRAAHPGTYRVLPARAEATREPERRGRGGAARLEVR